MGDPVESRRRAVVLLTGMSGAGKSTTLAELAARGHRVADTDDPVWLLELGTAEGPEPGWNAQRITELLDRHQDGWLFIAGCVVNQGSFYDCFDAVVLLSAPVDVLLSRVAQRSNAFGSTPVDRAKIASDQEIYEPLLRAGASHEMVTTMPVAELATEVERIASGR